LARDVERTTDVDGLARRLSFRKYVEWIAFYEIDALIRDATSDGKDAAAALAGIDWSVLDAAVAAVQAQKQQKRQATGSPAGVARPPLPPPTQAPAPAPNLPLSTFAEGGLINDQSGQATQQIRNRLGVQ